MSEGFSGDAQRLALVEDFRAEFDTLEDVNSKLDRLFRVISQLGYSRSRLYLLSPDQGAFLGSVPYVPAANHQGRGHVVAHVPRPKGTGVALAA